MKVELTDEAIEHIDKVIGYLWDDEETHYFGGFEEDHIFLHIRGLAKFLDDAGVSGYHQILKSSAEEEKEARAA